MENDKSNPLLEFINVNAFLSSPGRYSGPTTPNSFAIYSYVPSNYIFI